MEINARLLMVVASIPALLFLGSKKCKGLGRELVFFSPQTAL